MSARRDATIWSRQKPWSHAYRAGAVACSILFLLAAASEADAQTIRSVSERTLRVEPGRTVELRVDGVGLGGVTEVRFLQGKREVKGLKSSVRAGIESPVEPSSVPASHPSIRPTIPFGISTIASNSAAP